MEAYDTIFLVLATHLMLRLLYYGNNFSASAQQSGAPSLKFYVNSTGHGWEGKNYVFNYEFGKYVN